MLMKSDNNKVANIILRTRNDKNLFIVPVDFEGYKDIEVIGFLGWIMADSLSLVQTILLQFFFEF